MQELSRLSLHTAGGVSSQASFGPRWQQNKRQPPTFTEPSPTSGANLSAPVSQWQQLGNLVQCIAWRPQDGGTGTCGRVRHAAGCTAGALLHRWIRKRQDGKKGVGSEGRPQRLCCTRQAGVGGGGASGRWRGDKAAPASSRQPCPQGTLGGRADPWPPPNGASSYRLHRPGPRGQVLSHSLGWLLQMVLQGCSGKLARLPCQ